MTERLNWTELNSVIICSVQFSRSVVSDFLWPHEPQHARPPCPSPTPRVYPNPCLLSRWCHPTILSSVTHLSSCPQSFPASGSFPMSQLFTSGSHSIGASASTGSKELDSTERPTKLQYMHENSVQFSSVAQSCPTLCDPMNRSTPGLPIHHQLPEFTQTHIHRVSDACRTLIQKAGRSSITST